MPSDREIQDLVKSISLAKWEDSLGIGKVSGVQIETILRLTHSYVIRLRIVGSDQTTGVYVKIFRRVETIDNKDPQDLLHNEFKNLVKWQEKFSNSTKFKTVKPLFFQQDQNIIATQEAEGISLIQVLRGINLFPSSKRMTEVKENLFNVGQWQNYFQSLSPKSDKKFSIEEFINYVDIRLKELTGNPQRKFPKSYRDKILKYISNQKKTFGKNDYKLALSHGDFALGNILVTDQVVTVLDFGEVTLDSFLLDIARIYHQLFLMTVKPTFRTSIISQLQDAFLKGFGLENAEHLTIFRFLLIRHTLTHLVSITRFWKKDMKERVYNSLVLRTELKFLDQLLSSECVSKM